jgi:glycosyltransferase involved in cell wall biosynthesis
MNNKHQLKPTVSVRFMVYNNEPYIREAIEGILIQQTNFLVEIVVGDDFSTDNTLNIIKEYKDTSNIYFNILQREVGGTYWKDRKRLGRLHNFRNIIENCSGKYIALLDGDDYWTDPLKLQKQVDFLENNLDYVMHSGVAKILKDGEESTNEEYVGCRDKEESLTIKDFLGKNNLITCTVLFRNCLTEFPKAFNHVTFGDWFLYIMLLHQTKLKMYRSAEVFAVYRIHDKGVMKTQLSININKQQINQILSIKQYIGYKTFPPSVIKWINNYSIPKFRYEIAHKMYRSAFNTFILNVYYCKLKISGRRYLSVFKHNLKIFR